MYEMRQTCALLTAIVAIMAGSGISVPMNAQYWPMANGCKERTSWAEMEKDLLPPLLKTVGFSLSGNASGISYYDQMLLVSVGGEPNRLVAFSAQNGNELWHFEIPNSGGSVNVTPAIHDSLILSGGQGGLGLYALDRHTGMEKWFKGVGTLYSNNPIIDSDRVYVVADSLYCLGIGDGATIWSFPLSSGITPALDDLMLYICRDDKLMALDKSNGEIAWQIDGRDRYHNTIAIDEYYLYTCRGDSVLALNKENGSVHWSHGIPDGLFPDLSTGAIAISDSFLCVSIWENADKNGQLYTLNKITGEYRWHFTFDTTGVFTPAIANGYVYAVNWKSESVWGFNLHTGQAVFFDDSERYLKACIVADGKLFMGALGKVVTFENYGTGTSSALMPDEEPAGMLNLWPNPFTHSTTLEFLLERPGFLDISVYDLSGKKIKTISYRFFEAGIHTLSWEGTDERSRKVPPGVYVLRLSTGHSIRTISMILIR
jgi:outer membrane protein assembly factor BamB